MLLAPAAPPEAVLQPVLAKQTFRAQERMTRQIAECLMENVGAAGVAVMCEAT